MGSGFDNLLSAPTSNEGRCSKSSILRIGERQPAHGRWLMANSECGMTHFQLRISNVMGDVAALFTFRIGTKVDPELCKGTENG